MPGKQVSFAETLDPRIRGPSQKAGAALSNGNCHVSGFDRQRQTLRYKLSIATTTSGNGSCSVCRCRRAVMVRIGRPSLLNDSFHFLRGLLDCLEQVFDGITIEVSVLKGR